MASVEKYENLGAHYTYLIILNNLVYKGIFYIPYIVNALRFLAQNF